MGIVTVPTERVVRATAATVSFQYVDQYGDPADPGVVTVGIVDSQGATVVAAGEATSGADDAPRTVALTQAQTADLDVLTATWTATDPNPDVVVGTTTIDVVGGVFLSVPEIKTYENALTGASPELLREKRAEVETLFEDKCNRAFVPRYTVERIHGAGTPALVLRHPNLRAVRFARYTAGSTTIDIDVSDIEPDDSGIAYLPTRCWPCARIEIGYEHGFSRCPDDLRAHVASTVRMRVNVPKSGIDPRAISYQTTEGQNVILSNPSRDWWVTGDVNIDGALKRYRWRRPVVV